MDLVGGDPADRDNLPVVADAPSHAGMFATGTMPEPYENIYEKTQIFLAGFKSSRVRRRPGALTESVTGVRRPESCRYGVTE